MKKLTDTQTLILTCASARPGNLALPLPEGLHGAVAKMAVGRMIELELIEEVYANFRRSEPLWRETGDGHGTTLIATETGLVADGIDPAVIKTMVGLRDAKPEAIAAQRPGTKQAQLIAMLQVPDGATVAEIAEATGWQAHSIRCAISGTLKKKLGLHVSSERDSPRGGSIECPRLIDRAPGACEASPAQALIAVETSWPVRVCRVVRLASRCYRGDEVGVANASHVNCPDRPSRVTGWRSGAAGLIAHAGSR